MKTTVAIVEDDKNYNNALKSLLDYSDDLLCVGQFFSGIEALEKIPELSPDVVLMDIQLNDYLGCDLVKIFKSKNITSNFIMCTNYEDEDKIFASFRAGALGYIIKGEGMDKIINSIKEVSKGATPMSNSVAHKVLKHFQNLDQKSTIVNSLTNTELEILELLSEGKMYKEIADKKFVSIETVKKHVSNIYKKLGVSNKVEAINLFNSHL